MEEEARLNKSSFRVMPIQSNDMLRDSMEQSRLRDSLND
jgi:hypothetical protein